MSKPASTGLIAGLELMRPQQWLKNLFVFLPLFFGGELFSGPAWRQSVVAFIAFCLVSSAIYCLNDLRDLAADRAHPRKCRRPLASGRVAPLTATILMAALTAASLCAALFLPTDNNVALAAVVGIYLVLNVLYCLVLKRFAIIDVFVIAFGYVLRLVAGGVATSIPLSPWIVLMTFLIALFLAFAKRRDDVVIRNETGAVTRNSALQYNIEFLNLTLGVLAAVTIVCYIMYTVSAEVVERLGSAYVYVTSVFVIAGILRYLQVTIVEGRSGSPTRVLMHDVFVQSCLVLWILTFVIILYL